MGFRGICAPWQRRERRSVYMWNLWWGETWTLRMEQCWQCIMFSRYTCRKCGQLRITIMGENWRRQYASCRLEYFSWFNAVMPIIPLTNEISEGYAQPVCWGTWLSELRIFCRNVNPRIDTNKCRCQSGRMAWNQGLSGIEDSPAALSLCPIADGTTTTVWSGVTTDVEILTTP